MSENADYLERIRAIEENTKSIEVSEEREVKKGIIMKLSKEQLEEEKKKILEIYLNELRMLMGEEKKTDPVDVIKWFYSESADSDIFHNYHKLTIAFLKAYNDLFLDTNEE